MLDWSLGTYELTAGDLEPAAAHAVELAGVGPGLVGDAVELQAFRVTSRCVAIVVER